MTTRTTASADGVNPPDEAHSSPQATRDDVPVEPLAAHEKQLHRLTAVACLVVAGSSVVGNWFAFMHRGDGRGWIVVLEFATLAVAAVTIQLDFGLPGWMARTAVACGLLAAVLGVLFGVRIIGTSWLDLGYAGVPGFVMSLFGLWVTTVSWQARSRGGYSEAVTFLGLVVGGGLIGAVVLDFRGTPQWLAIGAFAPAFLGTLLLPAWFALLGAVHLTNPHPQTPATVTPTARPVPPPPPGPVAPRARGGHDVSPDRRGSWDGSNRRPVQPPKQRHLRDMPIAMTAILTGASVLLGALALPAAGLMSIGVADLGAGGGHFVHHSSDFLTSQAGLLSGAILGVLAMALRPRHLVHKRLAAVGIGLSLGAAVLFTQIYWG